MVTNNSAGGVTFFDKFTCATFTCTTPGAHLYFKYRETDEKFFITASGGLHLESDSSDYIYLRRYDGTGSDQWDIYPSGGSWTVNYVDVENSYNSQFTYINPSNSVDNGNNFNWFTQDATSSTTTTSTPITTTTTTIPTYTTTIPTNTTTIPTTTIPPTTTTTPIITTSTTTQPFSCEVVIIPSSETVGFEDTLQFNASTACDGEPVVGIYIWDVDSLIGSTIDDNGLYKAGTEEGEDTVIATDIANDNIFDTSTVIVGLSIEVSPSEVLRSRWIPLFALMYIKGEGTNFELFKTRVDYDTTSVLPLPALILSPTDIYQIILVMPSLLTGIGFDGESETVTVTVEGVSDTFEIKMLPAPLDEDNNLK